MALSSGTTLGIYEIVSLLGFPAWSPDGKELFFRDSGRLAVSVITTKPSFTFASPVLLTISSFPPSSFERNFDVMPDGKRFLA